jgi:hypothetical protein
MVGRRAGGVLDAHAARLDAADAPRRVAEQDDVARHRFDREVLVDVADHRALGLQHDVVVCVVGDGAARRQRRQARAAPAAQPRLTASRWTIAPARPRLVAMPSDRHVDDGVEVGARELGVGRRPAARARRADPRRTLRRRVAATICCAITSSGASRSRTASISARRAARTSAAHSTS